MIESFEELPIIGEKIKAEETKGLQEQFLEIIINLLEDKFQSVDEIQELFNNILIKG